MNRNDIIRLAREAGAHEHYVSENDDMPWSLEFSQTNLEEFAALVAAEKDKDIERLQAERDAAVKDAERYRWLRDWDEGKHHITPMWGRYSDTPILKEELDAAIDAARGEK